MSEGESGEGQVYWREETLSAEELGTCQELEESLCVAAFNPRVTKKPSCPGFLTSSHSVHMGRKSLQPQLPTNLQKKSQTVSFHQ